jgi:WD40 repeat protein
MSWSPDGKILALTTSYDQYLLYDVSSSKRQEPQIMPWPADPLMATFVHGWLGSKKVSTVVSQRRSRSLLTVSPDGKWQATPEEAFEIDLSSCAVSLSRRHVALANARKAEVHLYTFRSGDPALYKSKIYQPEKPYWSDHQTSRYYDTPSSLVAWSQDSKYLATSFHPLLNRIYIWDAITGLTQQVLETKQEQVISLAWGPDHLLCWGGRGSFQISQVL